MSTPSTDLARLDKVSDLLKAKYGDLGAQAADQLALWLSGSIPLSNPDVIAALLRDDGVPLLFDSFWRLVPFGTGGRRGPVGYGPNRINPSVVAMTVQGHCDYLKQDGRTDLSVVVANDVRVFKDIGQTYRALGPSHPILGTSSRSLARMACEIYAGNGVRAYLQDASSTSDNAVMTTPMLSFAIRRLGAQGGVNMSASHNPPDDNGIKVYDEYGAQPIPPNDQRLADRMELVTSVARMAFDDAVREGLIRTVPGEVQSEYVRIYTELSGTRS
jgi:phosphoglucomutase